MLLVETFEDYQDILIYLDDVEETYFTMDINYRVSISLVEIEYKIQYKVQLIIYN